MTLTLRNFDTFIGYEVIDTPANFNYSTSLPFQNRPFILSHGTQGKF
ncbi:MAG: outer membrane beta-barrel protein [Flavobacteriales bacterium]